MAAAVQISDTSLRDGEQTPGVHFDREQKVAIARMLDRFGVAEIEAGIPAMGTDQQADFRALTQLGLRARLMAWNRANWKDIEASLNAGATALEISFPASDIHIEHKLGRSRRWVIDMMRKIITELASPGIYLSIGAEDASRADARFVQQMLECARDCGADRVRYCDTLGILDPDSTRERLLALCDQGIDIEFHGHNDLGLATANSLAAARTGARVLDTTVLGIGERAGNAALEQVALLLERNQLVDPACPLELPLLPQLATLVSEASGIPIAPQQPLVGQLCFTHESGIHTDGILKNPQNYEAFDPAGIGRSRELVLGTHSGTGLFRHMLQLAGIDETSEQTDEMFQRARHWSAQHRRTLTHRDLRQALRQRSGEFA